MATSTDAPIDPAAAGRRGRGLAWLTVLAALAGGVAAWGIGEAALDRFRPSVEAASEPYAFKQLNKEKDEADGRNAAIAYGALGGLVALGVGLVAGFGRSGMRGAVGAGLVGLVVGTLAGALPCPWTVPQYRRNYTPEAPSLVLPVLIHGASWGALGAAAGLAYGVGRGDRRRLVPAVLGGLLGGLIGTVAYNTLGALAFPEAQADLPIATVATARLLARLLVAGGVALGVIWFSRADAPPAPAPPPLEPAAS